MWKRFALYGLLGWGVEVAFTGSHAVLVEKDPTAPARSYLWMYPIYGLGGLALELSERLLRKRTAVERGVLGVAAIYAIEYTSGRLLRRALGRCPWDYGCNGLNVHGLVRLDYAPFWLALAFAFAPLRRALMAGAEPKRRRLFLRWASA